MGWTEENGKWFYSLLGSLGKQGYDAMVQWPYIIGASLMYVPGYRPFPHIFEKLCEDNGWDIDDVLWSFSEPYQNQVFGWSLGTGWIQARECVRQAYNEICGFDEKEMYFIQFEPISTFACTIPWEDSLQGVDSMSADAVSPETRSDAVGKFY